MTIPAEKIPDDVVEAAQRGLERRTTRIADFRVRDLLAAVFDELDFPPDFFELPKELDVCRPVEVDGETIRVRGEQPVNAETQAALTDVVRAAKRRHEAEKATECAEIRRQAIRDLHAGKVPLAEIAAAQGITGPQRVEDLSSAIDFTDEEADAFVAGVAGGRASAGAEGERQVRQRVLAEVEEIMRTSPDTDGLVSRLNAWLGGLQRDTAGVSPMPEVDLLAELDDNCGCGRPVEECEEAGGCRWTRALAAREREVRAEVVEKIAAYRCDFQLCGECSCRAELVKLIGGTDA